MSKVAFIFRKSTLFRADRSSENYERPAEAPYPRQVHDSHMFSGRWELLSHVVDFILRICAGFKYALGRGSKRSTGDSSRGQAPSPSRWVVPDLTGSIIPETSRPFAISPCCDVYKRTLNGVGTVVIRRIRFQCDEIDSDNALARQATLLVTARHDRVLLFLGTCTFEGSLCIVSPFARSGDLRRFLKAEPQSDLTRLLLEISEGLEYLHGRGIIHGNLHLGNVLLSENHSAMLSEFGLAEIIPDEGTTSMRSAFCREKAMHRAPEIHMGESLAPSSDVYSFGMLAFHLYCDGEPMRALYPGAIHVAAALLSGRRPGRNEITRADFSDSLWDLVQWCWAHKKAKRPLSARVRVDLGREPSF
ncbi:kinase-like protein [Auricularia subglabra TFB-10046 SS5]|nr:kinase-like protein [Auricularia subglabra TFB-10046 SS5]